MPRTQTYILQNKPTGKHIFHGMSLWANKHYVKCAYRPKIHSLKCAYGANIHFTEWGYMQTYIIQN